MKQENTPMIESPRAGMVALQARADETAGKPVMVVTATNGNLRRSVSRILARVPFDVHEALSAPECLSLVAALQPDLVVVECTGSSSLFPLLRKLRDLGPSPVMLIGPDTAQGLGALRMGLSVDYMQSPVWERELRARAGRYAARRSPGEVVRAGDLTIDETARTVRVGGTAVELSALEFDLLHYLASHPGVVFTREQLLERVWMSSIGWQRLDTVTEHVFRLRRKLEIDPAAPNWIITVPRAGYYFNDHPATIARPAGRRRTG